MSQLWDPPVGGTLQSVGRGKFNDCLDSLKSCFISTALPNTNLVAGMWAIETTTNTINVRNAANDAWIVMGVYGQVLGGLDRCAPEVAITVEAEDTPSSGDRRFSIQVKDRAGNNLAGYYRLHVWFGTADHGAPAGAQTLSVPTGTLLATLTANQVIEIETDSTGLAKVIANLGAGSFTRYLMCTPGNAPVQSLVATWA